jgi:hypothetical protein
MHKPIWQDLLNAGWGVWGAIEGDVLKLCARNPAYTQDICVSEKRRPGLTRDEVLGNYMWDELYKRVGQAAK